MGEATGVVDLLGRGPNAVGSFNSINGCELVYSAKVDFYLDESGDRAYRWIVLERCSYLDSVFNVDLSLVSIEEKLLTCAIKFQVVSIGADDLKESGSTIFRLLQLFANFVLDMRKLFSNDFALRVGHDVGNCEGQDFCLLTRVLDD